MAPRRIPKASGPSQYGFGGRTSSAPIPINVDDDMGDVVDWSEGEVNDEEIAAISQSIKNSLSAAIADTDQEKAD